MSDQNRNTKTAKRAGNPPTHFAKVCHGSGEGAPFEKIGAAWVNDKGTIYMKLRGTQVVFVPYALSDPSQDTECSDAEGDPPTHVVKTQHGSGENGTYQEIGFAWQDEKGSFGVKLHDKQVLSAFKP